MTRAVYDFIKKQEISAHKRTSHVVIESCAPTGFEVAA